MPKTRLARPPDRRIARAHDTALALLVAEAGRLFARSLDLEQTIRDIGELVVGWFADWCVVDLITPAGFRRMNVAAVDAGDAETARALRQFPLDPARPSLIHQALSTRRPVLVPTLTEDQLGALSQGREHRALLSRMKITSYAAVPLVARDRLVGNLLVATKAGSLGRAELHAVEEIAALAAVAIDNAQRFRQATDALDERANRLAMVAHDLRSPLSNIVFASGLLQLRLREAGIDGLDGVLDTIVGSSNYMARLVDDLTDVARAESGGLSVARGPVPVAPLVRDVVAAYRGPADALGIVLTSKVAAGAGSIVADRGRIFQVLSNLVGNALKFTAGGGEVRICAESAGRSVEFAVTDTGRGIAPDVVDRIFEAFWRDDDRPDRGLGLGLTIAKRIVELHGGRIRASSTPGVGTRLHFTVPASPAEARSDADADWNSSPDPEAVDAHAAAVHHEASAGDL
jgi:signal transduction histidine kinase